MAIVMPLLLLLLFGIIDMGRLLQQQIQLTEAAREAARIGALNGTTSDVQAEVTAVVGSGVPVTYPSTPVTCTASSGVGANATVVLQRSFSPATPLVALLPLFGGSSSTAWTLKATGIMSCTG
jgi:Flp pilus assembly protein TadG